MKPSQPSQHTRQNRKKPSFNSHKTLKKLSRNPQENQKIISFCKNIKINVDIAMEGALSGVQASMYSVVAPRELLTVTARYASSMVFYMDGSLIDGCAASAFCNICFAERVAGQVGRC
jgi:hypothetical protein